MGYSHCSSTDSKKTPVQISVNSLSKVSDVEICDGDQYCKFNEMGFKSILMKMIWGFRFGCFTGNGKNNKKKKNPDHNKAWLLAESGGDLAYGEPHTVHSSFRFSLCSQVEVESMKTTSFDPCTTVLMVNLDNNNNDNLSESHSREVICQKIESLEKSISPVVHSLIRFTYEEIVSATHNFSQGRVLGRGALSCVFRGRVGLLRTAVAIKKLDKEDNETPKAFCRELMIANSLEHPNIVPLLGFCIDSQEGLFLVYKYVSSGSLERHLHGKNRGAKGFASFSWSVRYKVAVGIAEAIDYLHNGTEKCIVHRDIKPSNILLSSKKRPKLCDFGLATWTPAPSIPFLCKTVKGTFGYLAPEYFQHGKVSDKTDVYAFGVVLLELITGRNPIEAGRPPGEENLVQWAKPLFGRGDAALNKLLDPRAKITPRSSKQITLMVRAAAACLNSEDSCRPGIEEVITLLRGESKAGVSRLGCRSQRLQRSKSEMKNHLTLAMLGVSELEDDDCLYCR